MRRYRSVLGAGIAVVVAGALLFAVYRMYQPGSLGERLDRAAERWSFLTAASTWSFLFRGLLLTLELAVVSIVLSMIFGVALALLRLAPHPLIGMPMPRAAARAVRAPVSVLVEVIRSAPLFMLILFTFIAAPKLGLRLNPVPSAILALTLYTSCVLSEIVRAGILSLDRGQFEAAASLGLSYRRRLAWVVLPQALRRMVPAILSQLVTLLKDTSLASLITVTELARRGQILFQIEFNPIETVLLLLAIYFLINYALSRVARRFELRPVRAAVGKTSLVLGEEDQMSFGTEPREPALGRR